MLKEFAAEISVVLIILFLYLSRASFVQYQSFNPDYLFSKEYSVAREVFYKITSPEVWSLYKTFLAFLTIFFFSIISYCAIRLLEIRKKEHAHLHHEIHEYALHQKEKAEKERGEASVSHNPRWNKVLTYLSSSSSSDWKLAIIEADAMLENLSSDLGFKGTTLGDRLKMANQENFKGLSSAWEVHNIRNRIAHEGLAFELTEREAKRVIALYEQIFRNYGFI
ncbi:MAG: hypothetical protein KA515_01885 [Candidatus Pacebacteria bacterium]|nr:hypothetical protein [Candidatus Paceibacterota bacterium]